MVAYDLTIIPTFVNTFLFPMLDRIRLLLSEQHLSSTQFADVIGVSRPVISHILSGRNKPSLEVVQKILSAFPDLSTTWLLTGTGGMRKAESITKAAIPAKREAVPSLPASPVAVEAPEPAKLALAETPEPSVRGSEQLPVELPVQAELPQPAIAPPAAPVAAESVGGPFSRAVTEASHAGKAAVPSPDALLAQSLAEPGKRIRRIVIFYQDGTFSDYQPE
ncbi:helix-turn-helix domain-containing protein [Hymenobacter sp. UYP22]|uniref:helix-turn-helix domain-containing protein n=1 Tax=Hymenobacter sp. UYP22 TaxID=3156348 RepID=UPI0033992614